MNHELMRALHAETPTADDSCTILGRYLKDREPFAYARFGDGDIQFMFGLRDGITADGEKNTPQLSLALRRAWCTLASHPRTIMGDFLTCGDFGKAREQEHFDEWSNMIFLGAPRKLLHVEAPLLTRLSPELYELYKTIQDDPRPKLLVGPQRIRGAADLLGADFHEIPLESAFEVCDDLIHTLKRSAADVLYFCAGRTTKVVMAALLQEDPNRVYFDLGSAMDPLFSGKKTRGVQVLQPAALEFFKPLIGCKLQALDNMRTFHDVAASVNFPFVLMDGTLLGLVRDGDLCPGDEDDIDVGVMDGDFERVTEFCRLMEKQGFRQTDVFTHKRKVQGVKLQRGRSHFDIIRISHHPERAECYNLGRMPGRVLAFVYHERHHINRTYTWSKSDQLEPNYGRRRFLDRWWNVPADAEGFLTARYGDWKTPIPRAQFDWFNQSNRESIRMEYDQL